MTNALVNIRFIENSRGEQTLVHNDFLFRLKTRKGDSRYWYCVDKDCGAKINTNDEMVIKIKVNHNHDQDRTTVCAKEMLSLVRERNLQELAAADIWYMDGTFYSSQTYFHQVYSIHALINRFMCPLVYALLSNKQRKTCTRFCPFKKLIGSK